MYTQYSFVLNTAMPCFLYPFICRDTVSHLSTVILLWSLVYESLWGLVFFWYGSSSGVAWVYSNYQRSIGVTSYYTSTSSHKRSNFTASSATCIYFHFVKIIALLVDYITVGLIYIFLMTTKTEYLFRCAHWSFSSKKMISQACFLFSSFHWVVRVV